MKVRVYNVLGFFFQQQAVRNSLTGAHDISVSPQNLVLQWKTKEPESYL